MPKNITIYPDGDGASITVPYFYFDGGTASMTGRVVATSGSTTSFQWTPTNLLGNPINRAPRQTC